MNPRNGNAAADPSRRRGPKSRKHAREDAGAFGSGNGSETEANFPFRGVTSPSSAVEIKHYCGLLPFYRRVRGPRGEAAMVYDLAQCYEDPNFPEEKLNIRDVVRFKMEEDPALPKPQGLDIGKEFYVFFVLKHPLKIPREQWKKENLAAVLDEIVAKASQCLRALKEEIARKCRVRGRQRTDLAEILPSLPEDYLKQYPDLQKENQDLKDKAAEDASTITRLQESLQKALEQSQPKVFPQYDHLSPLQKENQDLKDENQDLKVKVAEDASTITRLQESLQKAPVQSQPGVFHQYDHVSMENFCRRMAGQQGLFGVVTC